MELLANGLHGARPAVSPMPPLHLAEFSDGFRPLNIVHITASLSPHVGGPATVAMHLAAAQASLGHDVSILSGLHKRDQAALQIAAAGVRDFSRVKVHLDRRAKGWSGLLRNRGHIAGADVVHLHGIWEPMLLAAGLQAHRRGIPYIVRPCGMLDPWCLAQRPLKKRTALWLAHRRMLNAAACIHVLTPQEAASVRALHITSPQTIIPNGVDLQEIDDAPTDAIDAKVPALRGKPYVLFLGRLHYKKGLDILAEAFARVGTLLPEVQLLVVGPDDGEKAPFIQRATRLGIAGRMHLTGALEGAAKFSALKNAAVFCLPSHQEGFSNAVIEAMAAGVPVAISNECNFPEVERINAGRVFPLQIEAATKALYELLSKSSVQRRQMGAAGRAYIERKHTWIEAAGKTISAYHAAIGTANGRQSAQHSAAAPPLVLEQRATA